MSDKKRIKTEIRKQLKASIPTWNRLSKQTKKELCQSIMKKVTLQYYQGTLPSSEHYEQLQLHPIPAGVMSLTDMKDFVSYMSKKLFTVSIIPCCIFVQALTKLTVFPTNTLTYLFIQSYLKRCKLINLQNIFSRREGVKEKSM